MAGGGGTTKSTVTQTNLPEYARPYYESMMQRAQQESTTDYIPYQGDRIADMSNATKAGLNAATAYGTSGTDLLNSSASAVQNAATRAANTSYTPGSFNAGYTGNELGPYQTNTYQAEKLGFGSGGIDNIGTGTFNQAAAQQYMSPYMDAVVNKAQADALQKAAEEQATRNLQAAKAGSFGGSRAAVQNQMANNSLQSNLTDIMVRGQQAAFENAQSQFNTDQARLLEAARANQQAGLTMGQSNQQAALEAARLREQSGQFGYETQQSALQKAADMRLQEQQAAEQSRQFGSDIGLRGLDLSRQAGMDLNTLQQAKDDATMSRIKSLLGVGTTLEDYEQQELDQRYNDFVNQRDAERMNLQFLSSILQGVPISVNQDVTSTNGGNNLQGLLGTAGGLQALMSLGNR